MKGDLTRWPSDWNADRWVSVDLGAQSTIDTVDLHWGATGWNRDATAYTPLRFPGQYDDT